MLYLKLDQQLPKEDSKHLFKTLVRLNISGIIKNVNATQILICVIIGDCCQYWKDLEKMEISSPYYPQNYFADGDICEWLITAPEGNKIFLTFDHFNVSKRIKFFKRNIHFVPWQHCFTLTKFKI